MTTFDIVVCIPLLFGIIRGFIKGVVIEIASLISLVLGVYCAVKFSGSLDTYLKESFDLTSAYLPIFTFILILISVIGLVFLLAKLLEKVVKITGLDIVNKSLGAAFGGLKFALLISVLILTLDAFKSNEPFFSAETRENSYLYKPVTVLAPLAVPSIKEKIRQIQFKTEEPNLAISHE